MAKNARRELTASQQIPRTRFNAPASGHRLFDARWWPFDQVRSIRALVAGSTVNDAVMATISGALRRCLDAKGELPANSLYTFLPMSVRGEQEGQNGGNEVVQLTVRLHTDVGDPLQRFARICASAAQSKQQISAIGARTLTDLAAILPGALVGCACRAQLAVAARAPAMANLFISNVPGPQIPLYFMGARQIRVMGISPLVSGIGLAHIVGTYNGEFIICFTADRDVMPDPGLLCRMHRAIAAGVAHGGVGSADASRNWLNAAAI